MGTGPANGAPPHELAGAVERAAAAAAAPSDSSPNAAPTPPHAIALPPSSMPPSVGSALVSTPPQRAAIPPPSEAHRQRYVQIFSLLQGSSPGGGGVGRAKSYSVLKKSGVQHVDSWIDACNA